jgi:hypothetical protein
MVGPDHHPVMVTQEQTTADLPIIEAGANGNGSLQSQRLRQAARASHIYWLRGNGQSIATTQNRLDSANFRRAATSMARVSDRPVTSLEVCQIGRDFWVTSMDRVSDVYADYFRMARDPTGIAKRRLTMRGAHRRVPRVADVKALSEVVESGDR